MEVIMREAGGKDLFVYPVVDIGDADRREGMRGGRRGGGCHTDGVVHAASALFCALAAC